VRYSLDFFSPTTSRFRDLGESTQSDEEDYRLTFQFYSDEVLPLWVPNLCGSDDCPCSPYFLRLLLGYDEKTCVFLDVPII
jgi:hypothetical protein